MTDQLTSNPVIRLMDTKEKVAIVIKPASPDDPDDIPRHCKTGMPSLAFAFLCMSALASCDVGYTGEASSDTIPVAAMRVASPPPAALASPAVPPTP